jgi:hypothetical protein
MTRNYDLAGVCQHHLRSFTLLVGVCIFVASCGGGTNTNSNATPTVASVVVTPGSPSIAMNTTQQFTAVAKDGSGGVMSGVTFAWTSSATTVATINSSTGIATGVSAGSTQITASASGVSSSPDALTVTAPVIATITVAPASPSIPVNATQQFAATAKDSGGNTIAGVVFTWASSAASVATINSSGLASGVAAGTTQITAKASGVTSAPDALQVTVPVTMVTGTASMGLPIANVPIALKDSAGNSVTGTTGSNGAYSLVTTGMTPPFLIQVQALSGNVYSVSADTLATTTINTHVLSDLIIRSWYSAQGQSIDTAFANPVSLPAPGVSNEQIIANAVVLSTQLWLTNAGVNTTVFNVISTPFTADGTGFDSVLHDTTVNVGTGTITIANGTTTQTSTVVYNSGSDAMTINSSTTTAGVTSTNSVTTVIPGTTPEQTAITAINTTFAAFTNVVNTKGSLLAVADVTPFLAGSLLNDGETQTQYAAILVSNFVDELSLGAGATMSVGQVQLIRSIDLTNGLADVVFNQAVLQNGVTVSGLPDVAGVNEYWFVRSGSTWLIGGDNQIAQTQLQVGPTTQVGTQTGSSTIANANISVPDGNLAAPSSQTISGGTDNPGGIGTNIFNNATFSLGNQVSEGSFLQDDLYADSAALNSVIPAGTPFLFTITPVTGPVATYTVLSNAFTNEMTSIISPTSATASNYIGQSVTLNWTLPQTFPISSIHLDVNVQDGPAGSPGITCSSGLLVAPNATSGTIAVPSTLTCASGQAVTQGRIKVEVFGFNGEYTTAGVYFQ